MKILGFGSLRLNFNLYTPLIIKPKEEVKLTRSSYHVSGSVFNTMQILGLSRFKSIFHTAICNDRISMLIREQITLGQLDVRVLGYDGNSPVSYILIDHSGEKTMYSYDDENSNSILINHLSRNIDDDVSLIYTSIYEINRHNFKVTESVFCQMAQSGKYVFVDLSPTVNALDPDIWDSILPYVTVLLGTEDEFNILLSIQDLDTPFSLIDKYKIKKTYVKMGENGGYVLGNDGQKHICNIIPVNSKNLTGCGDAFNAGVIIGELSDLAPQQILRIANDFGRNVASFGFVPKKIMSVFSENNYLY